MHIVIMGNPVDGFTYTGPFADIDDATAYGGRNGGGDWWIAALEATL